MIDWKNVFARFRLDEKYYENLHLNSVLEQMAYAEHLANSNYVDYYEADPDSLVTHYWATFYSTMSNMREDLESLNNGESIDRRIARLKGAMDSCNMIIEFIKAGEFDKKLISERSK